MATRTQPSRVAIVEDQRAFAEALTLALEFTDDLRVVCTAANAETGLEAIDKTRPDLVIVDYRLRGDESGVDLANRLREAERATPNKPPTPVVVLTGYTAPKVLREAADVRCLSVLSKDAPISEIVGGLRCALAGESSEAEAAADPYDLSDGELEVLEFLTLGYNAAEIAEALCLSIHAIRARIKSTLRKMGASSQLEAVALAARAGLAVPPLRPTERPRRCEQPTDRRRPPSSRPGSTHPLDHARRGAA